MNNDSVIYARDLRKSYGALEAVIWRDVRTGATTRRLLAHLFLFIGADPHTARRQAISGAGYAGVASYAILDNVIPFISGEEDKIESEPLKILGRWTNGKFENAPFRISDLEIRVGRVHRGELDHLAGDNRGDPLVGGGGRQGVRAGLVRDRAAPEDRVGTDEEQVGPLELLRRLIVLDELDLQAGLA